MPKLASAPLKPIDITDDARRRGLIFLCLASAGVGFALNLQLSLNSNFLVGEIGISGLQAGLLEAVRESCGIAAFGFLALLAGLTEPIIAFIVLLLFWAGLSTYAFVPSYGLVMAMSVVWSQGLHIWMPLPNSMTLALAERGRTGARLGQVQGATAMGSGIGLAIAFVLTLLGVRIRPLYLIAGAGAFLAAAACLGIPRQIKTPGPGLVFHRRYLTYYVLQFLEGWRKQVAMAFAGFLLVKRHGAPLTHMILLWASVQAVGWLASSRVGRLVDRIGEKKVLTFYYASMILVFIGYAFVPHKPLLYAIFVLDGSFFVFAVALTTYVSRIAPASERTPTLSMGVAMNHVAAVAMPFLGGILWNRLGFQWAFLIGIPAAIASITVVLRLPATAPAAVGRLTGRAAGGAAASETD
jgi:predicted MFS family arabinose efflux permease